MVGDRCLIEVPGSDLKVPPLVTGTFGMLDIFQSIVGEADDKFAEQDKGELTELKQV